MGPNNYECSLSAYQMKTLHDDIMAGKVLIVDKAHYYELEARTKSQHDLLEACEDAMDKLCYICSGFCSCDECTRGETKKTLEAAIRKAKGE